MKRLLGVGLSLLLVGSAGAMRSKPPIVSLKTPVLSSRSIDGILQQIEDTMQQLEKLNSMISPEEAASAYLELHTCLMRDVCVEASGLFVDIDKSKDAGRTMIQMMLNLYNVKYDKSKRMLGLLRILGTEVTKDLNDIRLMFLEKPKMSELIDDIDEGECSQEEFREGLVQYVAMRFDNLLETLWDCLAHTHDYHIGESPDHEVSRHINRQK